MTKVKFLVAVAISSGMLGTVPAAAKVRTLVLGSYSLAADTAILDDLTATDARFDHASSGAYDLGAGLPTAAFLSNYDSILLFTDVGSVDLNDLSNRLGDYVDSGGGVVISTFWGQQGGNAGGKLNAPGYNPLTTPTVDAYSAQTLGVFTASDPLMAKVTTLTSGYFNGDYLPGLDAGATLAAAWASGRPLAAYNARHNVATITLNPNAALGNASGDYRPLFANALAFTAGATAAAVPEPATWTLMIGGFGLAGAAIRRRARVVA